MAWHFSLMGANCSVRRSATASFSQASAAFRGLMASAPSRASRAIGSQAWICDASGRQASSRRWTSAAAFVLQLGDGGAQRLGRPSRWPAASSSRSDGREGLLPRLEPDAGRLAPSSPTSAACRTVSARGMGSSVARRRRDVGRRRGPCVASRAASRRRFTSFAWCSCHSRIERGLLAADRAGPVAVAARGSGGPDRGRRPGPSIARPACRRSPSGPARRRAARGWRCRPGPRPRTTGWRSA